jgi:predicted enzyme related to lactoylglutathione lyase
MMLNLRVDGLDDLIAKLRAAGVEIITKAEWDDPSTGRFARIHDPEGNPIELWEPPAG